MAHHFWGASGHLLLDRRPGDGRLIVTDEFLKAYLARPELMPPEEACAAERGLHRRLLDAPRDAIPPAVIAAIADADARENWQMFLAFRDRMLAHDTLEAAFVAMIRQGVAGVPPLFIEQLIQIIARAALNDCEDAFVVRAAEAFHRPQRATVHEGTILLADAEIIQTHEEARAASPLLSMLGGEAVTDLEILKTTNADLYWNRSDANDFVLDLGGKPSGRAAFAGAIQAWVTHLLGIPVTVEAKETIADKDWRWFVGLDAEATFIGNRLWKGEAVPPEVASRVLALFELRFTDDSRVLPQARGAPVYLIMAQQGDRLLRMKPQNLVTGLPIRDNDA